MVLESILNPVKAEKKSHLMILLGIILTLMGALIAYNFFIDYASIVIVAFIALGATPVMYRIIKYEEQKDLQDLPEKILLQEHWKALKAFMYLFLGITLATTAIYVFLPWNTVTDLFVAQAKTFEGISGEITGMVTMDQLNIFSKIFFNNIKVLLIAIVFSFIYGAGAIFVLAWNATVIGVAIGNFIRSNILAYSELVGAEKFVTYFNVARLGLTRYVIHGVPEILGYFVGALAGGIISVAVIKHDFDSAKFEHIILDVADLLLIAIALIFIAAALEVWVTPAIFPSLYR